MTPMLSLSLSRTRTKASAFILMLDMRAGKMLSRSMRCVPSSARRDTAIIHYPRSRRNVTARNQSVDAAWNTSSASLKEPCMVPLSEQSVLPEQKRVLRSPVLFTTSLDIAKSTNISHNFSLAKDNCVLMSKNT